MLVEVADLWVGGGQPIPLRIISPSLNILECVLNLGDLFLLLFALLGKLFLYAHEILDFAAFRFLNRIRAMLTMIRMRAMMLTV